MFGKIWRNIILDGFAPATIAAWTKLKLFIDSVWLRATLEYLGQLITASANTALPTPPPKIAATAKAKTNPGNARHKSESLITRESIFPPKNPQETPTKVPNAVIKSTSASVDKILALAPIITLENISLPYASVPIM